MTVSQNTLPSQISPFYGIVWTYLDSIAIGVTARDLVTIATINPGASLSNSGLVAYVIVMYVIGLI